MEALRKSLSGSHNAYQFQTARQYMPSGFELSLRMLMSAEYTSKERTVGTVAAVSRDQQHNFSKLECESIRLLEGLGVEGDAHCGKTVKHRSRVRQDPTQPNLRQVHLIHAELLEELTRNGFDVAPATLGENILTQGLDILALPTGTVLRIGAGAAVQITGLRNPCAQLDKYQAGLTRAVLDRTENGEIIRKAGVMGIVVQEGVVEKGDLITVELPEEPHQALEPV